MKTTTSNYEKLEDDVDSGCKDEEVSDDNDDDGDDDDDEMILLPFLMIGFSLASSSTSISVATGFHRALKILKQKLK